MKKVKKEILSTWAFGGPIPDASVDSPSLPKEKQKKTMLKEALKLKGERNVPKLRVQTKLRKILPIKDWNFTSEQISCGY